MVEYKVLNSLREKFASRVDWFVRSHVARGAPRDLYKAALHLFNAGGKRFRPFIVLAVASMLGGSEAEERALPLAAAVELFHTYTLIHDDIMDNDDFRRGVPTVHKKWGIPFAILAGDLDYALTLKSLTLALPSESKAEGFERALFWKQVLEIVAEASVKVAEGQALDMSFEGTCDVDYNDYLEMIYLKTGALIEASAKLGAVAADPSDAYTIRMVGAYGKFVGVAFQIRDDILGIFGDPEKTGKPVYSDLRRGKKTVLVLYALSHASPTDRDKLLRVLRGEVSDEDSLREAADIVRRSGALEYAERLSADLVNTAKSILDRMEKAGKIANWEALTALRELAEYTITREK